MKDTFYVIVTRRGFDRATKSDSVNLKAGERIFPIDIEIDDAAFNPPMLPRIKMVVPSSALSGPIEVTIENGDLPEA